MKRIPTVLRIAPGLLALALLPVSNAGTDEPVPKKEKLPSKAVLRKYDANGDGQLDDGEMARQKADEKAKRDAQRAEELAKYDADRNNKLSKAEREKMKADKEAARAEHKAEKETTQDPRDEERK